jgi:DNA ligase-1
MEIKKTYETLYKLDTSDNIRVWYMELGVNGDEAGYRTVSGLRDGQLVTSEWHKCEPKNVGKRNATSTLSQAKKEIKSNYTAKKDAGYFEDVDNVNTYTTFKPMLATNYDDEVIEYELKKIYSQPKLDGIRCIARADGLWTRTGKQIVSVPHIWEEIKDIFIDHPNITLDGELYNHKFKDDFNKITSIVRKTKPSYEDFEFAEENIQYHVYDCVDCLDEEIEFCERKKKCKSLINGCEHIIFVETIMVLDQTHTDGLYESYIEEGYEGQILRRNKPYEHKRSHNLIKRKEFKSEEFTVIRVEEGLGNWSGYAKKFICETKDGDVFGAGVKGNQTVLRELYESKRKPKWATIRFFDYTPDGIPRFPVATDWGSGNKRID